MVATVLSLSAAVEVALELGVSTIRVEVLAVSLSTLSVSNFFLLLDGPVHVVDLGDRIPVDGTGSLLS